LTCDDSNEASYKIIEANRGVLERIERTPGQQAERRYWIEL
jgi:predicted acetyltransferase